MPQQTLSNGQTGLQIRNAINSNFTELYGTADGKALHGMPVNLLRRGDFVIFGDSISAGPRSNTPYTFYPNNKGNLWHDWWTYLASQRVKVVGNYAVGGKALRNVIDVQIPMALRSMHTYPTAALCAWGTNDMPDTDQEAAWQLHLQAIARLTSVGIKPILTKIPPFPMYAARQLAWNERVAAFAAANSLPIIDRNTPVCVTGIPTQWASGMSDDELHPNVAGHRATGIAIAADSTLAASFDASYPDIDLTSGTTADDDNLLGSRWNTLTGWDVSAFSNDERYWSNRVQTNLPGTPTSPSITFVTSEAKVATTTFACTTDVEVSMTMALLSGAFAGVFIQPMDASENLLGVEIALSFTLTNNNADRLGMIWTRISAPPGTAKYRLKINNFGVTYFGSLTARAANRLG